MKRILFNWRSLFLIFGLLLFSLNSNAQNTKLTRKEKKALMETQLNQNFYILDSLLNAKSFVLEADFLQDKYGVRVPVTSNLNFIKVDNPDGVLQTGSDNGYGYNGVGGVTASGRLGSWKLMKDTKDKTYTLSFNLMTQIGHYDVLMTVNSDNYATATITGLGSGQLTWVGHLATVNNASIFKGQNTI